MVHPHPRPPSRYPGQVCRRRVPTSGAVSTTVYALAQEAFSPPLTPRTLHSMRYKAVGGTPPSRIGPVFTVLGRCRTVIICRRRRTSPPMAGFPTASKDCRSRSTTNAWIDQKVEEGTAVVEPACKETTTTPGTAPHGGCPPPWTRINCFADSPVKTRAATSRVRLRSDLLNSDRLRWPRPFTRTSLRQLGCVQP